MLTSIRKRDGRQVPFDIDKIGGAIGKAFDATGMHKEPEVCRELAGQVAGKVEV